MFLSSRRQIRDPTGTRLPSTRLATRQTHRSSRVPDECTEMHLRDLHGMSERYQDGFRAHLGCTGSSPTPLSRSSKTTSSGIRAPRSRTTAAQGSFRAPTGQPVPRPKADLLKCECQSTCELPNQGPSGYGVDL